MAQVTTQENTPAPPHGKGAEVRRHELAAFQPDVTVLLVGWAEDRAARRPPRLWPWPAPKPSSAPA